MKPRFIDLFCGIGSFHYSLQKLGWQCVMACDIDPTARKTYEINYKLKPLGDIIDIDPKDIPSYDVLCAGFPCQPFSQCGRHLGFEDKRGTLFFQLLKFVDFHKPKVILLENVQGLLKHDGGRSFQCIKEELEKRDYLIDHRILKCNDLGIPQMRKRLFIVALHSSCEESKCLKEILNLDEFKKSTTLSEWFGKKFEKPFAFTIRCGGRSSPLRDKHNWDGYVVDGKEYRLTIQDCLSLQGFDPCTFQLAGSAQQQWKQVGNTIPTIFIECIAKNLMRKIFS